MKSAAACPGPDKRRPNASAHGLQRVIGKRGPVRADRGIKGIGAFRIDFVVQRLHPFHVGTELRLPAQIDGEMDAESSFVGHRINETFEGRATAHAEVIALRKLERRHMAVVEAANFACDVICMQPGAVDEIRRPEPRGRIARRRSGR